MSLILRNLTAHWRERANNGSTDIYIKLVLKFFIRVDISTEHARNFASDYRFYVCGRNDYCLWATGFKEVEVIDDTNVQVVLGLKKCPKSQINRGCVDAGTNKNIART